jgi:hypothetical protein
VNQNLENIHFGKYKCNCGCLEVDLRNCQAFKHSVANQARCQVTNSKDSFTLDLTSLHLQTSPIFACSIIGMLSMVYMPIPFSSWSLDKILSRSEHGLSRTFSEHPIMPHRLESFHSPAVHAQTVQISGLRMRPPSAIGLAQRD